MIIKNYIDYSIQARSMPILEWAKKMFVIMWWSACDKCLTSGGISDYIQHMM
jgi:hypothetical protein